MAEGAGAGLLAAVVALSKVDIRIARLGLEKKRIEGDLVKFRETAKQSETRFIAKKKVADEKRIACDREDKYLKGELDKLVQRRKALTTLNNYKLQEAAEREIDFASHQLSTQEDGLLQRMKESEELDAELKQLEAAFLAAKSQLEVAESEAAPNLSEIEKMLAEASAERTELAKTVTSAPVLTNYNRIKDRYPTDPVVPLVNKDTCSGCRMKVGPQVTVQISRQEVVRCPGCGRVLLLPEVAAS
jgi:predicted  nucleic acid-binding Zn-ribbon protein